MRVLLIDDHALFRGGLESLLERRGIDVIQAGDEREGMRLADECKPDVVLLDLRMPEIGGLQTLALLQEQQPDMPVVMLTTSSEEKDLVESLRKGAHGYLLKDMEPDDLIVALRAIVAGETIVAPSLTSVLAKFVQGGENSSDENAVAAPFDKLTPRELEILCHIVEGESNKVIAANLDISEGTVKLHVKAILRKLKAHSRIEAAVMAVEQGIYHRSQASDKI